MAEWVSGAGGSRLRAALFPVSGTPRGSVIVNPGRTEPIEKYFEVAGELNARGFAVLVHDWRGQGLSDRLLPNRRLGHAVGPDDFLVDLSAVIAAFEPRLPKPWLTLAHSMGGCLTLMALARGEARFVGAILSAPMCGVLTGGVPRPLARNLAYGLHAIGLGRGPVPGRDTEATPFASNIVTHDPARHDRYEALILAHPELGLGLPTWSWVKFAFQATEALQYGEGAPRIAIPVTVIAAAEDNIVDNAATRRVAARLPHGRLVIAPGAYHEVLQETDEIRALFWREFDAMAALAAPAAKVPPS